MAVGVPPDWEYISDSPHVQHLRVAARGISAFSIEFTKVIEAIRALAIARSHDRTSISTDHAATSHMFGLPLGH